MFEFMNYLSPDERDQLEELMASYRTPGDDPQPALTIACAVGSLLQFKKRRLDEDREAHEQALIPDISRRY